MVEKRNAYRVLVGKPERKQPRVRNRRKSWDNIKNAVRDTGEKGVDWTHLAQDREKWLAVVNTVINF
jgi:hypothetical protein